MGNTDIALSLLQVHYANQQHTGGNNYTQTRLPWSTTFPSSQQGPHTSIEGVSQPSLFPVRSAGLPACDYMQFTSVSSDKTNMLNDAVEVQQMTDAIRKEAAKKSNSKGSKGGKSSMQDVNKTSSLNNKKKPPKKRVSEVTNSQCRPTSNRKVQKVSYAGADESDDGDDDNYSGEDSDGASNKALSPLQMDSSSTSLRRSNRSPAGAHATHCSPLL